MAYEFIIKNETNSSKSSAVAGDTSQGGKNKEPEFSRGQKITAAALVVVQKAKPWINQVVSHEINLVDLRTGRREYSQKIQFAQQLGSQAIGIAENIATGYAIGNVAGAVTGAITGIMHTMISYAQKQDLINTENSLENITLSQNRIRAGVGGSRRT